MILRFPSSSYAARAIHSKNKPIMLVKECRDIPLSSMGFGEIHDFVKGISSLLSHGQQGDGIDKGVEVHTTAPTTFGQTRSSIEEHMYPAHIRFFASR